MELPEYTLEKCNAGGWKARFDTDTFPDIADRIRKNSDLDVDTDQMLLWHMDDVKISFVKSSGVMTVRTEDKESAQDLVKTAIS
jgi:hypothetical protein